MNEPLFPRAKLSTSVPEYVSKRVDQQVSKGTEVYLESLTSAKVCEHVADEQLKVELERYAKILRDYETFGKEQKGKSEPVVLEAEKVRKPDTKNKGEYTKRQENRDIKRWEVIKAQEKAQETAKLDTMSDVEPDDPIPVTTDQNANVVKSKASKTVCTALSADVPLLNVEAPVVDPIVISSDENNGDDNGNTVEKMVIEEDELNAIGAEVAENLWGITFDVPEETNLELGMKHPSQIAGINDFGIQELTWRPTLTEMWMDVTDWTDKVGQSNEAAQDKGVRPDSTVGGSAPCDPAIATKSVQDDSPLEIAKTVEDTEALSLDDVPLSERV